MVLETLGTGATGKVKLGIDTVTNTHVALKVMRKKASSKRQGEQVRREIEAMTQLRHPSVLELKHYEMDCKYPKHDGTFVASVLLVIELAGGGELFDFMMYTGAFSEPIASCYARQLLEALAECHEKGIYHRDLKPENLLLDDNFLLKVADFGYSAIQSLNESGFSDTLLQTECGTRSYMAPEILGHRPYKGSEADAWSAGVVIFIMITGNPPFQVSWRVERREGRGEEGKVITRKGKGREEREEEKNKDPEGRARKRNNYFTPPVCIHFPLSLTLPS